MYIDHISLLRLTGFITGAMFLALGARRLRSSASARADVRLLFATGCSLLLLSIFPESVALLSDAIFPEQRPGNRLLTILMIAVVVIWCFVLRERSKGARRDQQIDLLVRTITLERFLLSLGENVRRQGILILMPAHNEAQSLGGLLARIPTEIGHLPVTVLVINDGSSDETRAVAESHGALVLDIPFNRGGGAALRAGYDVADALGAEIAVTMDADGQHQPQEIPGLVGPILRDEADLVIGSRVLGDMENYSVVRKMGVYTFNLLINLLMATRVTDCASGFRAMRLHAVRKLRPIQDQYHTAELIIQAAKAGLRVTERPIFIARRRHGQSKKGNNLYYAANFLRTVVKTWWQ
ncbi:MAG: glycosyltransferase family 2 protein [Thermodesulfobacteriota bacterium]